MYRKKNRTLVRALGVGTASIAAAVLVAAPARAATATPISGPIGATVKIADNSLASVGAPVVQLRADACSANYTTPSPTVINGANVLKVADGLTFAVPAVPLGANGVAKAYNVCVYPGVAAGSNALIAAASNTVFTVHSGSTAGPASGPSGGGNTITVTAPAAVLTGITVPAALFTTAPCPAVFNAGGAVPATATKVTTGTANTAVTIQIPSGVVGTSTAPTPYNVCVYSGSTANDALLTAGTYAVNLPPITLSSASGSHDSANGITVNSGAIGLFGGAGAPGVLLTSALNCPGTWNPANAVAIAPGSVRRLAVNRLALTVPPLPLSGSGQPLPYLLCIYNGSAAESTMLAAAGYTSTVLPNPIAISPSAGPATGGIPITIMGTDFPTAPGSITATLGGAELTGVTPVSAGSFTAMLPAHAVQEDATLVVTTSAGSRALPGAFAFRDAIKVAPNSAPNTTSAIDVSVQGSGFLNYPFGTATDSARVYLVRGEYNGADIGSGVRANSPVADCGDVLVISDDELVCTLRLDRRLNATADGFVNPASYSRSLADDVTTVAGSRTITSAEKSFGPDDVGHPILQAGDTDIPANTFIKSVLSPAKAVISAAALNTNATPFDVTVGGSVRAVTTGLVTKAGGVTVSLVGATFTKADVGRLISATGVPVGTTITAVTPNGATATLSASATTDTSGDLTVTATTSGSTTISGTFTSADVGATFGDNALGIPPGSRIVSQTGSAAVLSTAATATSGASATVIVERPVSMTLYPASAVPQGAYNLTVVSNGAPDAVNTDPGYKQTSVTSSATFVVGSF
jgi:hypothetical protein